MIPGLCTVNIFSVWINRRGIPSKIMISTINYCAIMSLKGSEERQYIEERRCALWEKKLVTAREREATWPL
jgi:hypothetical protein